MKGNLTKKLQCDSITRIQKGDFFMNRIYSVSEGGSVTVFDENGQKKKVLYQDNIEDVLNQENIVDMINDLINYYKDLMKEDENIVNEKHLAHYGLVMPLYQRPWWSNPAVYFTVISGAFSLLGYVVSQFQDINDFRRNLCTVGNFSFWTTIGVLNQIKDNRNNKLLKSTRKDYHASIATIDYLEAMYGIEMKTLMDLTNSVQTRSNLVENTGLVVDLRESKDRTEKIKKNASLYWHAYQQMDRYLELIDEDNTQEELQEACDEVEINFDKLQDELHETYSTEEADFIAAVVNEERIKRLSYTK